MTSNGTVVGWAVAIVAAAGACSTSQDSAPADAGYTPPPLVAARPYGSKVPANYDPTKPTPLVLVLHGYSTGGLIESAYLGITALADAKGFLVAYPDGTVDSHGYHFWNATDFCCDLDHTGVDDVAYLGQVIDDMSARYDVDPKRIYVVGHSNGGFMAHRLGCDLAGRVAAIISLAGGQYDDASKCNPSEPVPVLQIHGDADMVVNYDGGTTIALFDGGVVFPGHYPSAHQTVATWAAKNGCAGMLAATGQTLDLDDSLPGAETEVDRYDGCAADVELWTIHGGGHIPALSKAWADDLWSFLDAHARR